MIFILTQDRFQKESVFSEKNFESVLMHELSHHYFTSLTGGTAAWFDEGLACVLGGQVYDDQQITKRQLGKALELFFDFDRSLFAVSQATVTGLIHHFGRKKVVAFLRKQKKRLKESGCVQTPVSRAFRNSLFGKRNMADRDERP